MCHFDCIHSAWTEIHWKFVIHSFGLLAISCVIFTKCRSLAGRASHSMFGIHFCCHCNVCECSICCMVVFCVFVFTLAWFGWILVVVVRVQWNVFYWRLLIRVSNVLYCIALYCHIHERTQRTAHTHFSLLFTLLPFAFLSRIH